MNQICRILSLAVACMGSLAMADVQRVAQVQTIDCDKIESRVARLACVKHKGSLNKSAFEYEKRKQSSQPKQTAKSSKRAGFATNSSAPIKGVGSDSKKAATARKPSKLASRLAPSSKGGRMQSRRQKRKEAHAQRRAQTRDKVKNIAKEKAKQLEDMMVLPVTDTKSNTKSATDKLPDQMVGSFKTNQRAPQQSNHDYSGLQASSDVDEDEGLFSYY